MRKTNKIIIAVILIAVMLLGIGYAAIQNITLNITGTATADPSQANFTVKFSETTSVSDASKVTAAVTNDTNATINVEGLTAAGETVTATYTVQNTSDDLSADLTVETTNSNEEYFIISSELEKTSLTAGEATTLTVTVELIKTPVSEAETATIGIQLTAAPVQPGEEGSTNSGSGTGGNTGTTVDRTGLNIGDYVNYTYDSAEAYSLTTAVSGYGSDQTIAQTSDLKWRIMSINSDGSVDLVAETVTTATVGLKGALGYNNGVYVLDDIAGKQYSNTSLGVTARSLKIEDIENQMNETGKSAIESFELDVDGDGTITENDVKYGQEVTLTTNKYYPNLYAYENGAGINTAEVKTNGIDVSDTGESVLTMPTTETYSQAGENGLTVKTNMYGWDATPTNYFDSSEFYNLIFGTTTNNWVASRFAVSGGGAAAFGLRLVDGSGLGDDGLFGSSEYAYGYSLALRPVVSLGSDIQITVSEGENSSENEHKIVLGN